jgi:hypothetical protein
MGQQMIGDLFDIIEGFPCVDLQTGANTGDWISMKNAASLLILFGSGVGTAGDDPTLTIQQAKDNSGTSVKALNLVTTPNKNWQKSAAVSLAAVTTWEDVSGNVTTNTITDTDSAEESHLLAIEFSASDLDVNNGFDYVRGTVADVGSNAQPGFLLYFKTPKVPANPDNVQSAI